MKTLLLFFCAAGILLFSSFIQAGKLYKWVDENGVVSYQDSPPPKGSKILEESTTETQAVRAVASKDPITIYTVENCDACAQVVKHLQELNVPLVELPLHNDREAQDIILERGNSLIAPTMFIGEQMLQGGNITNIERALNDSGYVVEKSESTNLEEGPSSESEGSDSDQAEG